MRELSTREIQVVSGGVDTLFGITQVGRGLTAFGVAGALIGSFSAGASVGTWVYNNYVGPKWVYP